MMNRLLASFLIGLLLSPELAEAQTADRSPWAVRAAHGAELSLKFSKQTSQKVSANRTPNASAPTSAVTLVEEIVCGNSVLDAGEQCDDGNVTKSDGCSEICLVEAGWQCTDPVPADTTNLISDPGFEAGLSGGFWDEYSYNFGTPICGESECFTAGQRSGSYWVWFGGIDASPEEAWVAQTITIPSEAAELRFWLMVPSCAMDDDYVQVLIDDNPVWQVLGNDPACGGGEYVEQIVDVSASADDAEHEIKFYSSTSTPPNEFADFYVDDVLLIHGPANPVPSMCTLISPLIFGDGFEDGGS